MVALVWLCGSQWVWAQSESPVSDSHRVVLYRYADVKQKSAITVYINGRYQTTFKQAGLTSICVSDPSVSVRSRLRPRHQTPKAEVDQTISFAANKALPEFVRIQEMTNGNTQMDVVSVQIAARDLKKSTEDILAMSRTSSCDERLSGQMLGTVEWATSVEFEVGQSGLMAIKPADLQALDLWIEQLHSQTDARHVLRLHVMGYASDGGTYNPSQQLAERRVQTVQGYILSQGIQAQVNSSDARSDKSGAFASADIGNVVIVTATFKQP